MPLYKSCYIDRKIYLNSKIIIKNICFIKINAQYSTLNTNRYRLDRLII